jgi:hypothetical protein
MTAASSPMPVEPAMNQEPSLSEPGRITNIFFAPSKTFTDIRRSASWWAPFVIGCLLSYLLTFAISSKVGWSQTAENTMKMRPKQYEKIEALPPDQQAATMGRVATSMKVISYCSPLLILFFDTIIAGILLATFNFGVGTEIKYSQALALIFYSGLVLSLKAILGAVTLFAGLNAETFNLSNYVGSNPAYYMSVADTPPWLYNLLNYLDVFTIWAYILLGIGFAIVGRKKISTGISVMAGWYVVIVLLTTGWAALMS